MAAHLITVIAQAVFAGQFLAGSDSHVAFHERAGQLAAALGIVQVLVVAGRRIPKKSLLAFLVSSIAVVLAEALQIGTGYARFLAVHVPLGVLICATLAVQLAWSLV